jgi:predicted outer membrane repeat protein
VNITTLRGGGNYYEYEGVADITACTISDNNAVGQNAFSSVGLGGGEYYEVNCNAILNKCEFIGNYAGYDGGGQCFDWSCAVEVNDCKYAGNYAANDGGALKCKSNATLTNCSFGNNKADSDNDGYGYGGAMDAYRPGTTLKVDFNNCSFSGNQAIYGGGFSSENFDANFIDCYFIGNTARDGGGLDLAYGDVFISGGAVKENSATDGDGGGFNCWSTIAEIRNCTISDNFADGVYPAGGSGGAINFYGGASAQAVFNCLITGNSAAVDGGAIFCSNATPEIGNCTFSGNLAGGYGGAIFSDFISNPNITDCIFEGCNSHAIHEEDFGGNAIVRYSLFYNNPDGDYYDSGTRLVYKGAGQVGSIPGGSNNLYGNPLFVSGDLGGYYLSQIAAGQGSNSPAINNGSDTAANLGLDTFTTRTDNVGDAGQVDRGYHYRDSAGVGTFQLTASVVGGHGSVAPTSGTYYAGTVVTLTATPNAGWRVKAWSGTDNDSSTATTNTVIMNSDRTVTVKFEQPKTLIVAVGGGGEGYYSTIQDAISDTKDGDTIVVYPGIYYGGYFGVSVYVDKSITIRSMHPDDPCCVAATIIDGYNEYQFNEGYNNLGVTFGPHTNADTILNGFTIQNCGGYWGTSIDGQRTPTNHPNGYDGGMGYGAAIRVASGGGPVIKNCVIRDNLVIGGNAGNGVAATGPPDGFNAGRGGWGGYAWGGAIHCGTNSSPTFINCRIIDNEARGGNGGDGGNDVVPGGYPNYGGNWSMRGTPEYPVLDIDPYSSTITFVTDGDLWQIWGYVGDYRWYGGYGGGVFCDIGSNVTFTDCEIRGNLAQGGVSGQGGVFTTSGRPIEPLIPYEIPSFGGGVYCRAGSTVTFTGCTITENISSEPNENNSHIDPYLGHGGGVCAEDTATLKFTNCTFSENEAAVGGGLHFADANPIINNCNFTFNSAYHGGGLFGEHGPATILRSNFTNNIASSEANDPNVVILGEGGGLHLWATEANIIDCTISSNQAEASGGGVFFGGEGTPLLTNCLLTNNTAGRDGGGVSSNIFTSLTISNCTIADNIVTGTGFETGYGSGLYCSYNSYTNIINSIIWGNLGNIGAQGLQLAIGTAFEYNPMPSTVNITYSDIQDATDPNAFGAKREALDLVFLIDTTGSMFDDIDAVKDAAYEITGAISTEIPDSRIAVVEYKDFNSSPYGGSTDYPYRTVLGFSTDTSEVVAALNSLTASGGADTPESVYTALMHCIDHNSLAEALGGSLYGADPASMGPGAWRPGNVLRVIILMGDAEPHDPEPFTNYTLEDIAAAAGGTEPKQIMPLLIGGDANAASSFGNLASETGGTVQRAAGAGEVVDALMDAIDLISRIPDPIVVDANCSLNWNSSSYSWSPNSHNIDEDPYFVDGYYLSQIAAGQLVNSDCVDAGSDTAENLGMDEYTTRTDGMFDVDIVDMGYHYLVAAWVDSCRLCELFHDGIINFEDFAVLASNWLSEDCSWGNDWCEHADVTFDGYVNFKDVLLFTECWLVEDTEPPFPNPSEWAVEPYSSPGETLISMTARTTVDRWGGVGEYYFDCVSGACNDSGWQDDPNYTDTGLAIGNEYGYKVKASDAGGNETGWSPVRYAVVGEEPPPPEDHNPPTPNPMTWATVPYATSSTSIAMVATTATDDTAGVEYYFEDFNDPAANSGWQGSPAWTDTTCEPNTTYSYRVRARDTSPWHNTTGWSVLSSATTPAPPPPPNQAPGPVAWEVTPYLTGSGNNCYANMTAAEATDPEGNGPVQYYFECTEATSINSGWTTERVWNNIYIGRGAIGFHFHFRVRDNLGNTSGWSTILLCY